jgi:uncharacterized protein YdiU (UPF0061 family)
MMNTNTTFYDLPASFYTEVLPTKVIAPKLVLWNDDLAKDLSLDMDNAQAKATVFSGNELMPGSKPLAQAYAGHQFGHFSILGDGRAALLGEQLSKAGKRYDIQLKGSGPTPYSRRGDGRGTLYSMLREYLISESMNALKIPTSRSLAVVSTGENVRREQVQKGAVLTRVASSHIRIGTFEFVAKTQSIKQVKQLADYAIERHYPALLKDKNPYVSFFKAVMNKQVDTVVGWLRVGFIHGVMNTDNITISGETIDYGPCAFMNGYDEHAVFSSIDTQGRYAFGNQGRILLWNLARLAETLLPLFDNDKDKALAIGQEGIDSYESSYLKAYNNMLAKKFGLTNVKEEDAVLISSFVNWMQDTKADYTNSFLSLESELKGGQSAIKFIKSDYSTEQVTQLNSFLFSWLHRVGSDSDSAVTLMQSVNPRVIPRNIKVESALTSAVDHNDFYEFDLLLKAVSKPHDLNVDYLDLQVTSPADDANYQTFCGT